PTPGAYADRSGLPPEEDKKHRINAHPARRIYRKIARIESGLRQKAFGSCDLIMEGETGAFKCLALSTSSPAQHGAFLWHSRNGAGLPSLAESVATDTKGWKNRTS